MYSTAPLWVFAYDSNPLPRISSTCKHKTRLMNTLINSRLVDWGLYPREIRIKRLWVLDPSGYSWVWLQGCQAKTGFMDTAEQPQPKSSQLATVLTAFTFILFELPVPWPTQCFGIVDPAYQHLAHGRMEHDGRWNILHEENYQNTTRKMVISKDEGNINRKPPNRHCSHIN